jgi:hypothetical protein
MSYCLLVAFLTTYAVLVADEIGATLIFLNDRLFIA